MILIVRIESTVGGVSMVKLFSALLLISGLALIVSVVFQESKTDGMGAVAGQSTSIWDRSSNDLDSLLGRVTFISSIVFMVSALVIATIG